MMMIMNSQNNPCEFETIRGRIIFEIRKLFHSLSNAPMRKHLWKAIKEKIFIKNKIKKSFFLFPCIVNDKRKAREGSSEFSYYPSCEGHKKKQRERKKGKKSERGEKFQLKKKH